MGVYAIGGAGGLRDALHRFMARYETLADPRNIEYRGYAIPVLPARRLEKGPLWLVGDAAGTAECLFGEGIFYALKCAELAARAMASGGAPGSYDRLMRAELLPELAAARRIALPIYRWQRLAWRHVVKNARLNDLFAGLMSGRSDYRQCWGALLGRLPLLPFSGRVRIDSSLRL